jgi:hypothetical protein
LLGTGKLFSANGQPFVGTDEIRTGTTAYFDTIAGLHHAIVKEQVVDDRHHRRADGHV